MLSRVAAALLLVLAAYSPVEAETLERVLGVVDERPVFLSDVRAVEWVDGISTKEALERVIDETLLFREASRLPQVTTTPGREPAVPAPSAGPGPAGEAALRRTLERRNAIRRYAAFRFRPQVRIDEEAIHKAYAERWGKAPSPPTLESVAGELREQLMVEAVDERVEAWVKDLRASARIRYNPID